VMNSVTNSAHISFTPWFLPWPPETYQASVRLQSLHA
jgi:hypothetical protein